MSRSSRKRFKKTHGPDFVENYDLSFEEPPPKCDYCLLTATCNRLGQPEKLLVCKDCNAKAHPSCMDYSDDLALRSTSSPWQCMDCKTCTVCEEAEDPHLMLFCDACDKGFHMNCHQPVVTEKPKGKWICQRCRNDSVSENKEEISEQTSSSCSNDDKKDENDKLMEENESDGGCSENSKDCSSKFAIDGVTGLPTPCSSPTLDSKIPCNQLNQINGTLDEIPDATDWSIDEVESHLSSVGFPDQAKLFRDQEIDGKSLLLMKRSDVLSGLNLKLGPALKIYGHVKRLQVKHSEPA
ncbi:sterile alpha motif domain containing [Chamberlinius hualienensis]